MTVVYADTLFLLNAAVDYLLLLAAACLAGGPLRRKRFGLAACLGGGYAVGLFVPGLGFLGHPLCKAASGGLLCLAAYGRRHLLRQSVVFLALTCALGGGLLCVTLLGGQGLSLGRGVVYSGADCSMVLLAAAGCYLLVSVFFKGAGQHSGVTGELLPARLTLGERTVELTALVDTGNTLRDPVSGRRVMVAEGAALEGLFPPEHRPDPDDLRDPAQGLLRLGTGAWRGRFRLLPYRAVGVERGLLLALKVDGLRLGGWEQGAALVALSPTPVSDGGSCRALTPPPEELEGRCAP